MRTSFIPESMLRVSIIDNNLFVFDDVQDQLVLSVSNINPSSDELQARKISDKKEFMNAIILPMVAEELQLDSIVIDQLF